MSYFFIFLGLSILSLASNPSILQLILVMSLIGIFSVGKNLGALSFSFSRFFIYENVMFSILWSYYSLILFWIHNMVCWKTFFC